MRTLRVGVHSHSNRLLVSLISLTFVTALVASLIAFGLARTRLASEHAVQLKTAESAVSSLLSAEQNRINSQLVLFSERPTLQTLLQAQQAAELELYIQDFRSQSNLDFLAIYRAEGTLLASNGRLNSYNVTSGQGFLLQDGRPLLATQQVIQMPGSDIPLGTAVAGIWLEEPFLKRIASVTGSQLELKPSTAVLNRQDTTLPLTNSTGQITLYVALTLPHADAAMAQELLWPLSLSTAVLTLLGTLVSLLLVQYQTASLQKLTAAAAQIGQGNSAAPLPLVAEPSEMRLLATALHRLQAQLITAQQQLEARQMEPGSLPKWGSSDRMTAPGFHFDGTRLEVQRHGHEPVRLTPLEARLLEILMRHPGQVMSSEVLITAVWGSDGGDRTMLKQLIYRLRSKITPDAAAPDHIETIPGVGYAFKN
ncbi:MAG: winged helix-turn-helix domain-containing protein [Anaerolineales bacterium]|nr:winged helix-turn-helix domain-containing protein [Anaerolineales bacterium]